MKTFGKRNGQWPKVIIRPEFSECPGNITSCPGLTSSPYVARFFFPPFLFSLPDNLNRKQTSSNLLSDFPAQVMAVMLRKHQ